MKDLVGGPLLVGGLGAPLNPALQRSDRHNVNGAASPPWRQIRSYNRRPRTIVQPYLSSGANVQFQPSSFPDAI